MTSTELAHAADYDSRNGNILDHHGPCEDCERHPCECVRLCRECRILKVFPGERECIWCCLRVDLAKTRTELSTI